MTASHRSQATRVVGTIVFAEAEKAGEQFADALAYALAAEAFAADSRFARPVRAR